MVAVLIFLPELSSLLEASKNIWLIPFSNIALSGVLHICVLDVK
jgi:hypothetical protein